MACTSFVIKRINGQWLLAVHERDILICCESLEGCFLKLKGLEPERKAA